MNRRVATYSVEITEQFHGKDPVVIMAKSGKLPDEDDSGTAIAHVSYRCGTKFSENYHSITVEVEVTLPVGLDAPHGREGYSSVPIKAAAKSAVAIAEAIYEKQSAYLRKALKRMAAG